MRLFLASQDLGDFAEVLREMVGEKKRVLVISNARDYYQDEARIEVPLAKTFVNLEKIGIESKRLDLRQYFGEIDSLADLITDYNPGLIFAIGGNVYCLATALAASGMDDLIRQGLKKDLFVYGGYSAGAMVASGELSPYVVKYPDQQPNHANPCLVSECYGIEQPLMYGLDIIDQYIAPHMDVEKHAETSKLRLMQFQQLGVEAILLNDSDVYVVDGDKKEVLRGK